MHDHTTGPLTGPHPMTPTGRALWVCLGPAGHPGRWTDNTTGTRGNLLELIARQRGDANNDTASAHAAERLLARCRSPLVTAAVIAPVLHDFNDDLLAHGHEALAARIGHAAGRLHFAKRETTPAPTTPSPAPHRGTLP